jgi:hypothetical protein
MDDPVGLMIRAFTRVLIFIGEIIGNGINALWMGALRNKNSGNFSRSKKLMQAQKDEQEETRRLAGCEEVVVNYANALGYIARECISREKRVEGIDTER